MIEETEFDDIDQTGNERLWRWFSCSYASWLALPRVLMHEMPDEWQQQMAELLEEYDQAWNFPDDLGSPNVSIKHKGKYQKLPHWLNYRHPDRKVIDAMRAKPPTGDSE